jgi:hypothetical protein
MIATEALLGVVVLAFAVMSPEPEVWTTLLGAVCGVALGLALGMTRHLLADRKNQPELAAVGSSYDRAERGMTGSCDLVTDSGM